MELLQQRIPKVSKAPKASKAPEAPKAPWFTKSPKMYRIELGECNMETQYQRLKRSRWMELVQECNRSGQSKRQWCLANHISYTSLCRWQKLLREELAESILEAAPAVPATTSQAIVPVCIQPPLAIPTESPTASEILLEKNGLLVHLPSDISAEYLVSVIRGLQ